MTAIKKEDIDPVIQPFLRESHGYVYLPEDRVGEARAAVVRIGPNLLACVREYKSGLRRFQVDKVCRKRLLRLFEIIVR